MEHEYFVRPVCAAERQDVVRQGADGHTSREVLWGRPMTRVENACASGSAAVHQGIRAILSGLADTVLVVGVEKVTHASGAEVGRALLVPDQQHAGTDFPAGFAGLFGQVAPAYIERYGAAGASLDDLDFTEVHDCFTIAELLVYEWAVWLSPTTRRYCAVPRECNWGGHRSGRGRCRRRRCGGGSPCPVVLGRGQPRARCRDVCRLVSRGRPPNPACLFLSTGPDPHVGVQFGRGSRRHPHLLRAGTYPL
ncbi:thiolase family protein [Nocardia tengchongensis]